MEAGWSHATAAIKYSEWARQATARAAAAATGAGPSAAALEQLAAIGWRAKQAEAALQHRTERHRRCFDAPFYLAASPDLHKLARQTPDPLGWALMHFQASGYKEGRPYRFTC